MGYTELGRKRPIELQIDYYDKILVYQHQGEIWVYVISTEKLIVFTTTLRTISFGLKFQICP